MKSTYLTTWHRKRSNHELRNFLDLRHQALADQEWDSADAELFAL